MSENFFNDTWTDNFPIDYNVAHTIFLDGSIVFGILWSILPVCFALSGSLLVVDEGSHLNIATWCGCWISLLFLFVGCMVMTKYAQDADIAHQHDYLGPMRVKGTQVYSRTVIMGCTNGGITCGGGQGFDECCFYHQFAIKVELEWGYNWACPQHDKKCVSFDTYEPCTTTACKSRWPSFECTTQELQDAESDTRDCAEMLYQTGLTYPDYDPRDPPGFDWPTWLAFGDCSTCTSRFIVPSNGKIRHVKIVGFIFAMIGILIWMFLLARCGIHWWKRRCSPWASRIDEGTGNGNTFAQPSLNNANGYGSISRPIEETYQGDAIYNPDFDY